MTLQDIGSFFSLYLSREAVTINVRILSLKKLGAGFRVNL